jgi:hypothetical protein
MRKMHIDSVLILENSIGSLFNILNLDIISFVNVMGPRISFDRRRASTPPRIENQARYSRPGEISRLLCQKTRAYIAKYFHTIAPDEAPENVKTPEKAPHLNPVTFLVHNTCSMLYAGVIEDNEPVFDSQYCKICMKWLSTDKHGFLDAERHCDAKHMPQP